MYPVYGLAEASLAVSFPPPGRAAAHAGPQPPPHESPATPVEPVPDADRDAVVLVSEGRPSPTAACASPMRRIASCRPGASATCTSRGENVTGGYFEDPAANAAAFSADGWLRTGDLGLFHEGELYISGRAKEIIFVNGQNYYPHDLEAIAQRAPGLELGKVVAAGVRPRGAQTEQLVVFVLHRGGMAEFLPLAAQAARLINEQTGLEVAEVVPVKRIPKTTSGKVQRHLLEEGYVDGEFDAELQRARRRCAARAARSGERRPQRDRGEAQEHLRYGAARQARRHPRQPVRDRRKFAEADRDPRADRPRVPGQGRPHRAVRLPDHRRAGRSTCRASSPAA